MLRNWCEFLSPEDIEEIHKTSVKLLEKVGVRFPHADALATFKAHGFEIVDQKVYLRERQVMDALASVPGQFTIHARDPGRDVVVGDGNTVLVPGSGAPYLVVPDVGMRVPDLADYHNIARLAHLLPNMDMTGHMMVMPSDVPAHQSHLYMLHASIVHSDKPFCGSVAGETEARQTMEMVSILFGEDAASLMGERPVTLGGVNSLTPLGYGVEMIEALMVYARWRQPLMIGAAAMAGATAPITLAGLLAVQNAELLAGITLTQLISPGTPVIYGSASGNMDMKTASLAIGSPEFSLLTSAHAQIARTYGLPCKAGGALTDSHSPDVQAGCECMLGLVTAVNSGVDLIVHAAGILSSFKAFSYEKFVLDDEVCGMVRRYRRGIQVNPDTLAYDLIAQVGPGGNYLTEAHTIERCRTAFWIPEIFGREGLEAWVAGGRPRANDRLWQRWQTLLAEHRDPPLDKTIARQLQDYVEDKIL